MALRKKVFLLTLFTVLISAFLSCGKYYVRPAQEIVPVHFMSATELTSAIRQGKISSVDLLGLCLDRIQRYNDDINAVVALNIAAARARAAEADKALARSADDLDLALKVLTAPDSRDKCDGQVVFRQPRQ